MNKNDVSAPQLQAKLFGYAGGEVCENWGWWGAAYKNLSFAELKDFVRGKTRLRKDPESGLWHHVDKGTPGISWFYGHSPGYFQVFWPPGRLMAQVLAEKALLIDDKCVLSIGPGSGLAEITLVKKRRPRVIACFDTDALARATLELNAAANDVAMGDILVTIGDSRALDAQPMGRKECRLFDTVLAADCLYNKENGRETEAQSLAALLRKMHRQGADIVIAERDMAEIRRRRGDTKGVRESQRAQEACGLTKKYLAAGAEMPLDKEAFRYINLVPNNASEPVTIHHWPASEARRPLPKFDAVWWRPERQVDKAAPGG